LKLSTSIGIKAINSEINIHQNMGFSTKVWKDYV
jgi:hypothetical protein